MEQGRKAVMYFTLGPWYDIKQPQQPSFREKVSCTRLAGSVTQEKRLLPVLWRETDRIQGALTEIFID